MIIMEEKNILIDSLGLVSHPEGGVFKEVFRSDRNVTLTENRYGSVYFFSKQGNHLE